MDDSMLHTKVKEEDFFWIGDDGVRYLFRKEVQDTPIRFYKKDSVFLKYKKRCPLFRQYIAQNNKDIVQFLLDCSERRTNLTCKNMFKCISKNKVKGLNEYNSCHECTHFYEGLVPRWEQFTHSHAQETNSADSNPESKHSNQQDPD